MSQAEFAKATGIAQRSISRYEQTTDLHEVKRPILLSWSFATGVPLAWLEKGEAGPADGGPGLTLPHLDSNQKPFGFPLALAA